MVSLSKAMAAFEIKALQKTENDRSTATETLGSVKSFLLDSLYTLSSLIVDKSARHTVKVAIAVAFLPCYSSMKIIKARPRNSKKQCRGIYVQYKP